MECDVRNGGIAVLRQHELCEQQMVGAESRIDGGEPGERANEEAGRHEQERGERDLKSDDGLPSDAASAFYSYGYRCAHGSERGREAEQNARGNRDERGKT